MDYLIGIGMVVSLFGVLFLGASRAIGFKAALAVFGISAALLLWISAAAYLITV